MSPSREPFRVRPVELVMLEQRWRALWNAVELGELPLQEWESLSGALSVVDPSGRRWRIASGSHPTVLRFVIASADGEEPASDTQWPWPKRRSGSGGPAADDAAVSLPTSWQVPVQLPMLAPRREEYPAYAPPARVAVLPDPARRPTPGRLRPRSWKLSVLDVSGAVRGAAALLVAAVCVIVGFGYRSSSDSGALTRQAAVETSVFEAVPPPVPLGDRVTLLPSLTGSLAPGTPAWSDVSCFAVERSTKVSCAAPHAYATGTLPYPLVVPSDASAACTSALAGAATGVISRVSDAQWVSIDGGLLVCTVARVDAEGTLIEGTSQLIAGSPSVNSVGAG